MKQESNKVESEDNDSDEEVKKDLSLVLFDMVKIETFNKVVLYS